MGYARFLPSTTTNIWITLRCTIGFQVLKPPSAASESQSRRVNHLKGARLHYSDKSLDFSGGNFETNEVQIGLKAHNDHLNFNKHVCLHPFPRSHFLLITTEHWLIAFGKPISRPCLVVMLSLIVGPSWRLELKAKWTLVLMQSCHTSSCKISGWQWCRFRHCLMSMLEEHSSYGCPVHTANWSMGLATPLSWVPYQ